MITVCYLSRNRPQYLARSLETVGNQTVQPSKIVVIDCSDDIESIKKVVEQFRNQCNISCELQWRPVADLSRSQGRNLGRQYVNTPLMISTECDILWPPIMIERTIKMFGNLQKKIYVQPYIAYCDKTGTKIRSTQQNHQTGFYQMFRTCDFDAIGGYNPFMSGWGYEDADFMLRLTKYGCKMIVTPLVVKHLQHKASSNKRAIEHRKNKQITGLTYWNGTKWKKKKQTKRRKK